MLKKHPVKRIIFFSFIIAIGGIVNDVFYTTHDFSVMMIKDALNPLNLDFVLAGQLLNYNGHNYINAIFDILLLIGAILYVVSKNKEIRLIRFVFSIILFSNILLFVTLILLLIFKSYFSMWVGHLPIHLINYAVNIFWIYLSFQILQFFSQSLSLQKDEFEENGKTYAYFIEATSWQRFLHYIVDLFISFLLFFPMSEALMYDSELYISSWIYRLIVAIIKVIVFYSFYEFVLGVSPAKLLTGTRVVDKNGEKPLLMSIITRTLSRLVPFEPFSFLDKNGWHDKWSKTIVVKEKDSAS